MKPRFNQFWVFAIGGILEAVIASSCLAEQRITTSQPGETIEIRKSFVRLTPVLTANLYSEITRKQQEHSNAAKAYRICSQTMDEYLCWKMYEKDLQIAENKVPISMVKLPHEVMYVILEYQPIVIDINRQKKIGEKTLVICLNPAVPEGYWQVINRYKPILKYTPNTKSSDKNPSDALKKRACEVFADFKNKSGPK